MDKHSIQKELLELTAYSRNSAVSLQNRASEVVRRQLNPALDRLFSRLGNADGVVRIDKLVVDLGTIREELFDEQFADRALKSIEEQLVKLIGNAQSDVALSAQKQPAEKDAGSARILSPADYDLELFIHFLKTGCFPWWKTADGPQPVNDMLHQALKLNAALLKKRISPLLTSLQTRKRLANQFGEEELTAFLRKIDEATVRHYLSYYSLLQFAVSSVEARNRKLQKVFFENILAQIAEGGATHTEYRDFVLLKTVLLEYLRLAPEASRQRVVEKIAQSSKNELETGEGEPAMVLLAALISAARLLLVDTDRIMGTISSTCGRKKYEQLLQLLRSFEPESAREQPMQESKSRQSGEDAEETTTPGADKQKDARSKSAEREPALPATEKDETMDISEREFAFSETTENTEGDGAFPERCKETEHERTTPGQSESRAREPLPAATDKKTECEFAFPGTCKDQKHRTLFPDSGETQGYRTEKEERAQVKPPAPLSKMDVEMDNIAITNAGLVILHPFLKYFFQGLGLLDNAWRFGTRDNAYKAVHLLQYLITGKQANPEYELPLNKLLCGLDLTEPVPEEVVLSDEEIDECHNLLGTVLEQWQALKTKQTEALKETFLKRDGILSPGNEGWMLKVERNTFDVLLDKLPWALSLIALPWSSQLLSVEW